MQPVNRLVERDSNINCITSSNLPSSKSINADSSYLLNTFRNNVFIIFKPMFKNLQQG